jgi:hypothetical protein
MEEESRQSVFKADVMDRGCLLRCCASYGAWPDHDVEQSQMMADVRWDPWRMFYRAIMMDIQLSSGNSC